MKPTTSLDQLNTEQLRNLAAQLLQNIERLDKEVLHNKTRNQQLIHEIAQLKRHRFAKRAESLTCGVQLQPLVDALRELVLKHEVVHVDETPVQMLGPGSKKTHRACVWAYATTSAADIQAVVYDFSPGRSGEYARNFLGDWKGKWVCNDYGGYKASFAAGVTEIGCMAMPAASFTNCTPPRKASSRSRHELDPVGQAQRT